MKYQMKYLLSSVRTLRSGCLSLTEEKLRTQTVKTTSLPPSSHTRTTQMTVFEFKRVPFREKREKNTWKVLRGLLKRFQREEIYAGKSEAFQVASTSVKVKSTAMPQKLYTHIILLVSLMLSGHRPWTDQCGHVLLFTTRFFLTNWQPVTYWA